MENKKYKTQNGTKVEAKNYFQKPYCEKLNKVSLGEIIEKSEKRVNSGLMVKCDIQSILNRQLKLCFDDKKAEHEKINLYSITKESIKFTKRVYIGLCVLEKSKSLIFECYNDKIVPSFAGKK